MATVKVSKETYEKLNRIAGRMRTSLNRPVSIDEALDSAMAKDKLKPSDFEGTFVLTEREAEATAEDLGRFWSRWPSRKD